MAGNTSMVHMGHSFVTGMGSTDGLGFLYKLYSLLSVNGRVAQYRGSQQSGGVPHEGYSGALASGLLPMVPRIMADYGPLRIVTVFVGVNEVYTGVRNAETVRTVSAIVDAIHAADRATEAVIVLPSLAEEPWQRHQVMHLAKDLREINGEHVRHVDTSALTEADLSDHVHPNDAGYQKIADAMARVLAPLMA